MATNAAILRGLAILRDTYPTFEIGPTTAKSWALTLEGVTDADFGAAVLAWLRSAAEFAPRPGQLRPKHPVLTLAPEELLDRALANPESLEGRIARRAGALRAGERYDDGTVSWYVPSRDHDPDGWRRAVYVVKDSLAALQAAPDSLGRMLELKRADASPEVTSLADRMAPPELRP